MRVSSCAGIVARALITLFALSLFLSGPEHRRRVGRFVASRFWPGSANALPPENGSLASCSRRTMETISDFERRVIQLALRGDEHWIRQLREQIPYLSVLRRDVFAGGVTTHLACDDRAVPVVVPREENGLPVSSYPPTVNAMRKMPVPGLASFIVWVGRDGRMVELEALSLTDDQWPVHAEEGFHAFQDDHGNLLDVAGILAI